MQEHGVFSGIDPQSGPIAPESIEQPRMNAEVFPRLLGVLLGVEGMSATWINWRAIGAGIGWA